LPFLGLGSQSASARRNTAAEAALKRTASSFRSKSALHAMQTAVMDWIKLLQYVNAAQTEPNIGPLLCI
jgi:hypothetical protein